MVAARAFDAGASAVHKQSAASAAAAEAAARPWQRFLAASDVCRFDSASSVLDAVVEVLHLAKQVLLHGFEFLQALLHLWIAVDARIRLRITG